MNVDSPERRWRHVQKSATKTFPVTRLQTCTRDRTERNQTQIKTSSRNPPKKLGRPHICRHVRTMTNQQSPPCFVPLWLQLTCSGSDTQLLSFGQSKWRTPPLQLEILIGSETQGPKTELPLAPLVQQLCVRKLPLCFMRPNFAPQKTLSKVSTSNGSYWCSWLQVRTARFWTVYTKQVHSEGEKKVSREAES